MIGDVFQRNCFLYALQAHILKDTRYKRVPVWVYYYKILKIDKEPSFGKLVLIN